MQRAFLKRGLPPWAAIGVTALVFGISHGELLQLPGLVLAGLVFGYLAFRTGRLGASIACHLAFNLVATVPLLVG
jgi:membrane protease YdiL (CAAX protease family)